MQTLGLPLPGSSAPPAPSPVGGAVPPAPISVGGIMEVESLGAMMKRADEAVKAQAEALQSLSVVQGLAGHVKKFWTTAEEAKRQVEQEMLEAMYCRRGEYTPERLQKIKELQQPAIYMMLGSSKMRSVEALLRDVLMGSGTEKPWTLRPTPNPELPVALVMQVKQILEAEIQQALMMGVDVSLEDARQRLREMREMLDNRLREEARVRCERMENKMEDQLVEGGFTDAIDEFICDLSTFKTAWIAGPIVRKKPKLKWSPEGELSVVEEMKLEWERVSPFDMYPAPWAKSAHDAPLIRKHKLTREALNELIGVEGYDEGSIRKVLELYGQGGLNNWTAVETQLAVAEGKDSTNATTNTGLVDALQYWGTASGQMLRDWGMKDTEVQDVAKEYHVEVWLIGTYVIRAVLNADPLARRPYYAASFQKVPGSVWGNAPYDLMKDAQDMCNAAARALAANMGISSGPQVAVLSDRMPPGEEVTSLFPWKVWQFTADPMGSTAAPITFFNPQSNAQELMGVYEKFAMLADEYTGIPRYMAGFDTSGAGRTASGISMMIGNASKVIKQVIGAVDFGVIQPALERLYYYNMRYSDDADLKGDVLVVARGALSLTTKEAAQIRLNEYMQATANPIDLQIMGLDGRAELHRQVLPRLDVNPDKVVPPASVMRTRQFIAQMQQQAAMQAAQQPPGKPAGKGLPAPSAKPKGQELSNGAPVTDHFEPQGA